MYGTESARKISVSHGLVIALCGCVTDCVRIYTDVGVLRTERGLAQDSDQIESLEVVANE